MGRGSTTGRPRAPVRRGSAFVAREIVAVRHGRFERMLSGLTAVGAVLAALWAAGYFVFFWTTTGQTPGARVMRMRVRRADADASLDLRHALIRLGAAVLCALPLFLPYLLILVDARRRGLHDKLAHSVVVYAPRERRAR